MTGPDQMTVAIVYFDGWELKTELFADPEEAEEFAIEQGHPYKIVTIEDIGIDEDEVGE